MPPGTPVALYVTVRQDLSGAGGTADRLEISTRGTVAADGSLALEISRARLEMLGTLGEVEVADTDVVAAAASERTAEMQTWTRLLESIRAAPVHVKLDPRAGVVAVDGLDEALDAAVARDPALSAPRGRLSLLCSAVSWVRDLPAAGLCEVPAAVREGGAADRRVRVRVPGRGTTSMRIAGPLGEDPSGLRALRLAGTLAPDAEFDGAPGAVPPDEIGAVTLTDVAGVATTSYPPESGPPVQGEWTLTTPFGRGLTLTTTTSFKLVLR